MAFDASFHEQMESLVPQICRERTTLRLVLQHAVAEFSQHTLRLVFIPPHLSIPPGGAAVNVHGFRYGVVEGRSPARRAMAEACSATLAQIEASFYEIFWKEHRMHYRKYLTSQERTILTLLYLRWKRPAIAEHLCIAKRTVDTHCGNFFDKLNVRDKTEAIYAGRELGLFLHLT